MLDSVQPTLKTLPARPGVYIVHDRAGVVIYVGKAINLRNRVRSYFHRTSGQGSFKIKELVLHIAQLETIITESELEALILECNLIKKHRPKYNIRLKDDKNYLYVKIDVASPWPRVYTTRRVVKDGARYFGPYASAKSIRATLDVLKKIFPYRSCDMEITGQERRPCLDFHIHRCLGPCIGAAGSEDYAQVIQQVVLFLEGRSDQVAEWVHQRMTAAAEAMDYERAAAQFGTNTQSLAAYFSARLGNYSMSPARFTDNSAVPMTFPGIKELHARQLRDDSVNPDMDRTRAANDDDAGARPIATPQAAPAAGPPGGPGARGPGRRSS